MKVLLECRSIKPGMSCGIENFVYSLVRGFNIACPDTELFLNIPPGTRADYNKNICEKGVHFFEDIKKSYGFKSKLSLVSSIFKNDNFHVNNMSCAPRREWVEWCEQQVDVVLYPFQRDILSHLNRPSVIVMHDWRFVESGDKAVEKMQLYNLGKCNAIVTSWPRPFQILRKKCPERINESFMVPFVFEPFPAESEILGPEQPRVLLYAASLAPHKNHENLIRALGLLKKRGVEKVVVLCPGAQPGGRMEIIKQLVEQEGVADWIHFLGFVPREHIRWLYQICWGVIAPTLYEAFSGAVLEAFQYCKPVACSEIPSITALVDIIDAKVRFFNPLNCEDIANSIVDICENYEYYREQSKIGRRKLKNITCEKTAKQYNDVLLWACNKAEKPKWAPSSNFSEV